MTYPILNIARSHVVKYWFCFEWGAKSHFVNNTFNCAKEQHDDWIQSVEYYLDINGYADISQSY